MKRKNKKQNINVPISVRHYYPHVTKVVDATKPADVEVTPKDERIAKIHDPRDCAFAIACKRTFRADAVLIFLTTAYVIMGKTAMRFKNTGALEREVVSFDRKAGFWKGRYRLSPPSPSARLGIERSPGGRGKPANGKGIKAFRHFTEGVRTVKRGAPEIS